MGRPKHSSYRSYQLIYARLLQGPLWLEDCKSTGLKSRSTVHRRLKFLVSRGLVKRRRQGHKILYEMVPTQNADGTITLEGIEWHGLLYPMSRKEKRRIGRGIRKCGKQILNMGKLNSRVLEVIDETWRRIDKIIENPRNREVYELLREIGIDWKQIPITNLLEFLLYPHLEDQLCISCLRESKRIIYYVTDPNTGEVICPVEGIVVREEPQLIRHSRERPSPFSYDYED